MTISPDQMCDLSGQEPGRYLPFVGTLFVFITTASLLTIVPWYLPTTGSRLPRRR